MSLSLFIDLLCPLQQLTQDIRGDILIYLLMNRSISVYALSLTGHTAKTKKITHEYRTSYILGGGGDFLDTLITI